MILAVVLGVAGYPVYVRPQTDVPRPADAILVLGGTASAPRYLTGLDLAADGLAPTLVLSNPYRPRDPVLDALCAQRQSGFAVHCFAPEPRTTLGEGRELRRLAAENGWRSVVVVTSTPHVSRARYIIGKCFDGELIMIGTPARLSVVGWAWLYAYHSAGYIKSWLQGQC
ncbi:hypothetical protein BCA37_25530 [Mycobacterium sp. djl-10]|nr:hypothetical protein BCA37_25530 [Mycobacterium sp. djl-10]